MNFKHFSINFYSRLKRKGKGEGFPASVTKIHQLKEMQVWAWQDLLSSSVVLTLNLDGANNVRANKVKEGDMIVLVSQQ